MNIFNKIWNWLTSPQEPSINKSINDSRTVAASKGKYSRQIISPKNLYKSQNNDKLNW